MRTKSVLRRSLTTLPAFNHVAVCVVFVVEAGCGLLTAQNVVLTGSLGGRVTDQSGAIIPEESVVMRNVATSVEQAGSRELLSQV